MKMVMGSGSLPRSFLMISGPDSIWEMQQRLRDAGAAGEVSGIVRLACEE
jgi:hypothetical protein